MKQGFIYLRSARVEWKLLFNFEGTERYLEKGYMKNLRSLKCGGVAQLGEHLLCKQGVRSSILLISTMRDKVKERTKTP